MNCLRLSLATIFIAVLSTISAAKDGDSGAQLVELSKPVYPPLARQANIFGDVVVEVTINRDGVRNASVLSGHPMLREAALTSARQSHFDGARCAADCSYRLKYAFKQSDEGNCCDGFSAVPTVAIGNPVVMDGEMETDVTITAQHICLCDAAFTITTRVRSLKCLFLWKCSTVTR